MRESRKVSAEAMDHERGSWERPRQFDPGEVAERIRDAIPPRKLPSRSRMRKGRRVPCWSCPILAEVDTINGNTLETLECVARNIRALAHECKKRHDREVSRA